MSKKSSVKPAVTQRTAQPNMIKGDNGNPVIMCPFCHPSHPLSVSGMSPCGTVLQLRALQVVYHAKYNDKMVCIKCKKGGREMVQFNNAFIHTHDCMPGVATFLETPKFSKMAQFVYRLPDKIKKMIEQYTGEAKSVEEVTENGTRTGKTLGYFFFTRGKNGSEKAG